MFDSHFELKACISRWTNIAPMQAACLSSMARRFIFPVSPTSPLYKIYQPRVTKKNFMMYKIIVKQTPCFIHIDKEAYRICERLLHDSPVFYFMRQGFGTLIDSIDSGL